MKFRKMILVSTIAATMLSSTVIVNANDNTVIDNTLVEEIQDTEEGNEETLETTENVENSEIPSETTTEDIVTENPIDLENVETINVLDNAESVAIAPRSVLVDGSYVVSTPADLLATVSAATEDITIKFDENFDFNLTETIELNNTSGFNITIDGGNKTFISNNAKHFTINSSNGSIIFQNMILDGNGAAGGINVNGGSTFKLINCEVKNNKNYQATMQLYASTNVTVENSSFVGNESNGPGYTGGAIGAEKVNNITLTVNNSYFYQNKGPTHSGTTSKATGGLGGGIVLYLSGGSKLVVDHCVFDENTTAGRSTVSDGAAIAIKNNNANVASAGDTTATITNSTFNGNFSHDDGGAILMEGTFATAGNACVVPTIENCTFINNVGDGDETLSNGGAIQFYYILSTATITNNTFYGNKIGDAVTSANGGAVSATMTSNSAYNFTNNLFIDNKNKGSNAKTTNVYGGTKVIDMGGNVGFDNNTEIVYPTVEREFGMNPLFAENGYAIYAGYNGATTVKNVLIAPESESDLSVGTDLLSADQRGKTRTKHSAGSVEIMWVKFNANTGQWNDITETTYNANGTDYTVFDTDLNLGYIRYSVNTQSTTDVTIPSDPTLPGSEWIFLGWSTTQITPGEGTVEDCLTENQLASLHYADQELFAVWGNKVAPGGGEEEEEKYTVTYDSNGGIGSVIDINEYELNEITTTKENDFTKDGFKFVGWNTEADGSGISYSENSDLTITGDITLYAQWEAVGGYIPEEVDPEEVYPEEVYPEEVVPEEIVPEEVVPEEAIDLENINDGETPAGVWTQDPESDELIFIPNDVPKTGDTNNVFMFVASSILAFIAAVLLFVKKRRLNK